MTIKKFVFGVLFFTHAINSAEEDDSDNKKISISTVEENVLITKNNWNTRKWGSIYFLFPHLSILNIICKIASVTKSTEHMGEKGSSLSFFGKVKQKPLRYLNSLLSGVVEYKYMFHKYCGINVRLNLNNLEACQTKEGFFFSLESSLEWIYGRKGKHIFSGNFSPLEFAFVENNAGSWADDFWKKCWTWGGVLLKYEYDRRFYLNFGKVKIMWYNLKDIRKEVLSIVANLLSIELGLNIIGVNDWRKKRKESIEI